eukprot:3511266-Prymnesium_polylepis.1
MDSTAVKRASTLPTTLPEMCTCLFGETSCSISLRAKYSGCRLHATEASAVVALMESMRCHCVHALDGEVDDHDARSVAAVAAMAHPLPTAAAGAAKLIGQIRQQSNCGVGIETAAVVLQKVLLVIAQHLTTAQTICKDL